MFYALTDFEPDAPAVYIVSSARVVKILAEGFQVWTSTPRARGANRSCDAELHWQMPRNSHAPSGYARVQ